MTFAYAKTGRIPVAFGVYVRGVGYVEIDCLVTPRTRRLNSWKEVPQGRSVCYGRAWRGVMAYSEKALSLPPPFSTQIILCDTILCE